MTPGYAAYPAPRDPGGPTADERNMAMLAHVLSIFAGFFAPGIIYLIKRNESRFVAFHALQALLWHLVQSVVLGGTAVVCVAIMVGSGVAPVFSRGVPPSPGFFAAFLLLFVVVGLFGIVNVVSAIYMGMQASGGRWTGYPVAGWLARKLGAQDDGD